jgi:hypothetical protein
VYLPTIALLATGLWLLGGQEGHPSILSRLTGVADTRLHIWLGWGLTAVVALGLVAGVRAIPTFLRETIRHAISNALSSPLIKAIMWNAESHNQIPRPYDGLLGHIIGQDHIPSGRSRLFQN